MAQPGSTSGGGRIAHEWLHMKASAKIAFDPEAPTTGDFRLDGSWNSEGTRPEFRDPLSELYWFVDMLVSKRRRSPETPPWEFAKRIASSRFTRAFPNAVSPDRSNHGRWTGTITLESGTTHLPWWLVSGSTASESAVILAGYQSLENLYPLLEMEANSRPELDIHPEAAQELFSMLGVEVPA